MVLLDKPTELKSVDLMRSASRPMPIHLSTIEHRNTAATLWTWLLVNYASHTDFMQHFVRVGFGSSLPYGVMSQKGLSCQTKLILLRRSHATSSPPMYLSGNKKNLSTTAALRIYTALFPVHCLFTTYTKAG